MLWRWFFVFMTVRTRALQYGIFFANGLAMIGNSWAEYVWVVASAALLHSIGPISFTFSILIALLPHSLQIPRYMQWWALAEAVFFVLTHIYLRWYVQSPATHPLPMPREEREKLFELCVNSTRDHEEYFSKWFFGEQFSAIKRENVKEFFRYAFLYTGLSDPEYNDEVEMYVEKVEERLGKQFEQGKANVKCLRISLDEVAALHRSLIWYMCISVVDVFTHIYLRANNFQFYRGSTKHSLAILPPRPHALIGSCRSTSKNLSYWYQPHTAPDELPILFIHGIGVGLCPYMELLKEINQARDEKKDGKIGIIAVELLSISSRLTSPMFRKDELCGQIRGILQRHGFDRFIVVSHSYGTVVTTHLLKTPDLASRISSVILVDPISILLNQPDVAYNFTARPPKSAIQWFLWYFGARDIGVAHTLFRTFFWSENILWKEDILNHRCIVFLGEKDSIVNASKVLAYLREGAEQADGGGGKEAITAAEIWQLNQNKSQSQSQNQETSSHLNVFWCPDLDHGQMFIASTWRARLKDEILREAKRLK